METKEKEEYTTDDFGEEIAEIAKRELEAKKTADFSGKGINPEDLTEEDMKFWLKVKIGDVTEKDAEKYSISYTESGGSKNETRFGFFSLAVNRASGIIGRRWLEEEKKKSGKQ